MTIECIDESFRIPVAQFRPELILVIQLRVLKVWIFIGVDKQGCFLHVTRLVDFIFELGVFGVSRKSCTLYVLSETRVVRRRSTHKVGSYRCVPDP